MSSHQRAHLKQASAYKPHPRKNVLYIHHLRRKSHINLWTRSGVFLACLSAWHFVLARRLLSGGSPKTASPDLMTRNTKLDDSLLGGVGSAG